MGCLKSILRLIVLIGIVFAFIYFGGPKFVKEKYDEYTSPPREVLIKEEKNFGNFTNIPEDYTFNRSITLGKYKKITAKNSTNGQKISLTDIGDTTTINQSDFYSKKIDTKLYELLDKFKNTPLGFDDVTVTQRGTILAKGKIVPYVNFEAKLKNVPFITITGTLAAFNTQNTNDGIISKIEKTINENKNRVTTKVILSTGTKNKYSFDTTKKFIESISFTGIN